jgi:hypothetical protein
MKVRRSRGIPVIALFAAIITLAGMAPVAALAGGDTRIPARTDPSREAHIVYLTYGNPCVDASVTNYLVTGELPATDVTCTDTIATSTRSAPSTDVSR